MSRTRTRGALVDLSHTLEDGLLTYPGLPAPRIRDHLTRAASQAQYAAGTSFHIGRIELVGNTGTYLDAPFHRFADGPDLAELPLASLANLPGVVVDARERGRDIDADALAGVPVEGRAVLVCTGASRYFGTGAYAADSPYLTRAAARALCERRAALVGIDALNVDDTTDATRPVHTLLLEARIPVVEHLTNLAALPREGFRFFAVPVKVRGMGSFPVRAFALLREPGTGP